MQDNRDLFGFDRHRRNHSGSSSLGPSAIRDELQYLTVMTRQGAALDRCLRNSSAIRDELKYIHDDDDVIVKVLYVACCH